MLTIGDHFPEFNLKAVVSTSLSDAFTNIDQETYKDKWKVYFFWPKDFTFICPTELIAFADLDDAFKQRDTQLLGGSTDSEFVHHAWRTHHDGLSALPYPMLADIKRELCESLGILDKTEGVALRATFIVDPHNIIRHVSINDLNVGRNPDEIIRILDGLQNGGLCGCNWKKGDSPIDIAA